jgi:hypothetical protein
MIDHPVTQQAACTALDALLEILGSVIDLYLDPIMNKLIALFDTVPVKTKAVIIGAIGSAAHAAKDKFLPYFQPTLAKLEPFLSLTGEGEEIELRGITVDAIGTFAEAVGADAFRPFFPQMMQQAFLGLQSGSARLRECSFLFFGVTAKVFGKDFAPYLGDAVPALIQSLQQSEHGDTEIESGSFLCTSEGCFLISFQSMAAMLQASQVALERVPLKPSLSPTSKASKTSILTSCLK